MPEADAPRDGRTGEVVSVDATGGMSSGLLGGAAVAAGPAVSLTHLQPGRCGWVRTVDAVSVDVERLKVMGVCAGRKVRLVRRGDPLILCIWGTRVGVSRRLAEQVVVQPCPGPEQDSDCHQWGELAKPGGSTTQASAKESVQR